MRRNLQSVFLVVFLLGSVASGGRSFRDLAEMMAKGWFARHIDAEASVSECIAFLNQHGICFSLFDLADPHRTVGDEDFARAVGQATLLFKGEAEIQQGCIKKPGEAKSWIDFCILNDIEYDLLWRKFTGDKP